jgi:hypothetical protein
MKEHRERGKADFHNAKNISRRQEMKHNLYALGLVLILSVLGISGCVSSADQPTTSTPAVVEPSVTPSSEGGHITPTPTPTVAAVEVPAEVRAARDAALHCIFEQYGEQVNPPPGMDWLEKNITPEGLIGSVTYRFAARDLIVTVSFPLVAPDATIYQVLVENTATGFRWEGEVDAAGQVTDLGAPAGGTTAVAWLGYVVSTPDGAQFDDFVTILPEGQVGAFGIEGADEAIEAEIVALRDHEEPGKYANFWGTLRCDVIDYAGCQLLVTRIRSGIDITDPDPVEGWEGTLVGLTYDEPGAPQPDDAFILEGEYPVQYGIASFIAENGWPIYKEELENLRDTGQTIRVSGQLICGLPDVNGCQIQVNRLEIDGAEVDAYEGWATYTNQEYGVSFRYPDTWEIVEGGEISGEPVPDYITMISLEQGDSVFNIGVKFSSEDTNIFINRTESLEQMGHVYFLGQEVPRMAWIQDGRVLALRYGEPENVLDGGVIEANNLVFTLSLWQFGDDWPNTADISPEVQFEIDQIISSFELTE